MRRSPEHLGRSGKLKRLKNAEKVIVAKALKYSAALTEKIKYTTT